MTGFLDRMAARAQGVPLPGVPVAHLRRRSRFEPPPGDAVDVLASWPPLAPPPSDPSDEHRRPQDPVPAPAAARVPPSVAVRAPQRAGEEARGPASPRASRPRAEQPAVTTVGTATSAVSAPSGETHAAPAPDNRADAPQVGGRLPLVALDPLALVRDHVVPTLMDRGLLRAGEDPDVVDAAGPRQRPGSGAAGPREVQLRVATLLPSGASASDAIVQADGPARAPVVHVHIDRIEVIRPQAPPTPRPQAAPRSAPFAAHTAYLARRRGHG